jgi:hypothetical protein
MGFGQTKNIQLTASECNRERGCQRSVTRAPTEAISFTTSCVLPPAHRSLGLSVFHALDEAVVSRWALGQRRVRCPGLTCLS